MCNYSEAKYPQTSISEAMNLANAAMQTSIDEEHRSIGDAMYGVSDTATLSCYANCAECDRFFFPSQIGQVHCQECINDA